MAGTLQSPIDERPTGLGDPASPTLLRRSGAPLAGLALAGLVALVALWSQPVALLAVAVVLAAALVAVVRERGVTSHEAERRVEAEHVARILQGLSRSASSDEIAAALIADLAAGTGADHTVVVRYRAEDHALDATLAGARPGDPTTTTRLPVSDLDPSDAAGTDVTDRLEARVGTEFALTK